MRGGVYAWDESEESLREYVAMRRAQYAFQQRVERMRWERDVLAPAVAEYKQQLLEGTAERLELPNAS